MNLSDEDVSEILSILAGSSADEFYLETERFTLTLRRFSDGEWAQTRQVHAAPNVIESPTNADSQARPSDTRPQSSSHPTEGLHEVCAPLPGTFYRAPKPQADPFIEIGSHVQAHTVVGLIETMKLFNSVEAGACGTVIDICLPNGGACEQGTVLVRIDPDPQ
jgi:acetyl-CoA carboxylase biotin carboxyl carrier protein